MGPEKVSRKWGRQKGPEKETGKGAEKGGQKRGPEKVSGLQKTLFDCFSYKMFPKLLLKGGRARGPFGPSSISTPPDICYSWLPWKEESCTQAMRIFVTLNF